MEDRWKAGTLHYYLDDTALCGIYEGEPEKCKRCEKTAKKIAHYQSKRNEQELFDEED